MEGAVVCLHEVSAITVLTVPTVPHTSSKIYRHAVSITRCGKSKLRLRLIKLHAMDN